MILRCFSHAGQTIAERRLAYFAAEELPSPPVNNEKKAKEQPDLQKQNADLTKQNELLQRRLAAVERAKQIASQSSYPAGTRAVPRGVQNSSLYQDPRVRTRMESLSASRNIGGLIDYLPQYHIDQAGKVVAKPTPYGAVAYGLEDGAIRKRYDKERGLLTFVMTNGQWVYTGVESTPQQMRAATVRLNQESDARAAAKANHERMQLTWMRRGLDGDYVPPRDKQAREYEVMQYYTGLANGTVQTDPNYNPTWTDNYKVVGQYKGNGVAPTNPVPTAAREQAAERQKASFDARVEAWDANLRPSRANIIAAYVGTKAPTGSFVELPQDIAQWKEGGSYMYRIDAKGTVQAYQKGDGMYRYDEAINQWLKYSDEEVKQIMQEIAQGLPNGTKVPVPVFRPAPVSAAPRATTQTAQAFQTRRPLSAYDAPTKIPGVPPVSEQQRAVEEIKYAEAQRLPLNAWGRIDSAAYDSKDKTTRYMYRLLDGVTLQAYSPKTGLQQYDRQSGRWFFPGKGPTRYSQAEREYVDLFSKDAGSPPAVAPAEAAVAPQKPAPEVPVGVGTSTPASPSQKPAAAAPVVTPEQSKIIADGAKTLSNAIQGAAALYGVRVDTGASTLNPEQTKLADQLGRNLREVRNDAATSAPQPLEEKKETPAEQMPSAPKMTTDKPVEGQPAAPAENGDKKPTLQATLKELADETGAGNIEADFNAVAIVKENLVKIKEIFASLDTASKEAIKGKTVYLGNYNSNSMSHMTIDVEKPVSELVQRFKDYAKEIEVYTTLMSDIKNMRTKTGFQKIDLWFDGNASLAPLVKQNLGRIEALLSKLDPAIKEVIKDKTIFIDDSDGKSEGSVDINITKNDEEIVRHLHDYAELVKDTQK